MTSARQYEQTIRERRNLALLAEGEEPIGGRVPAVPLNAVSVSPVSPVAVSPAELASSPSASSDTKSAAPGVKAAPTSGGASGVGNEPGTGAAELSLLTPAPVVRPVRAGVTRVTL